MPFWKRPPQRTSGEEHAKALARSSADWASEIRRLQSEADQLAVERVAVVTQAGQATLDGQTAQAHDLTRRLTAIDAQTQVIASAISAAEARMADSEAAEGRRRLTLQLSEYRMLLANFAEACAVVREAEYRLTEATRARSGTVDTARLGSLYDALLNSGMAPEDATELVMPGKSADWLRAQASRLRSLVESGEQVDPSSVPPTKKQQAVAEAEAEAITAAPAAARRKRLDEIDGELVRARLTLRSARESRNRDAPQWAAKIVALEAERAALEAEGAELEGVGI